MTARASSAPSEEPERPCAALARSIHANWSRYIRITDQLCFVAGRNAWTNPVSGSRARQRESCRTSPILEDRSETIQRRALWRTSSAPVLREVTIRIVRKPPTGSSSDAPSVLCGASQAPEPADAVERCYMTRSGARSSIGAGVYRFSGTVVPRQVLPFSRCHWCGDPGWWLSARTCPRRGETSSLLRTGAGHRAPSDAITASEGGATAPPPISSVPSATIQREPSDRPMTSILLLTLTR